MFFSFKISIVLCFFSFKISIVFCIFLSKYPQCFSFSSQYRQFFVAKSLLSFFYTQSISTAQFFFSKISTFRFFNSLKMTSVCRFFLFQNFVYVKFFLPNYRLSFVLSTISHRKSPVFDAKQWVENFHNNSYEKGDARRLYSMIRRFAPVVNNILT